MKERPILFSGPMVRALLDGSKTQTRRIVKPQPEPWGADGGLSLPGFCASTEAEFSRSAPIFKCPYGRPSDRLWVRETHAKIIGQSGGWIETDYRATYTHGDRLGDTLGIKKRWTPAIHMPRDACRILLEINDVRVERLQAISRADARAEGAPPSHPSIDKVSREFGYEDFSRSWYAQLWDEINGAGAWAANPWVWAVEFRLLP